MLYRSILYEYFVLRQKYQLYQEKQNNNDNNNKQFKKKKTLFQDTSIFHGMRASIKRKQFTLKRIHMFTFNLTIQISQTISQSINQTIKQTINHPDNQPDNQSTRQSSSQQTNQRTIQRTNQLNQHRPHFTNIINRTTKGPATYHTINGYESMLLKDLMSLI